MKRKPEDIITLKAIIDTEACKYQKLRIHNISCIMVGNYIKVTGHISADNHIWDSPQIIVTIEGENRKIIDSRASTAYFCNKHGIFDIRIHTSDVIEFCGGTTKNIHAIGIMPLLKTASF